MTGIANSFSRRALVVTIYLVTAPCGACLHLESTFAASHPCIEQKFILAAPVVIAWVLCSSLLRSFPHFRRNDFRHTHGTPLVFGIAYLLSILLGVFASTAINPAGADGLVFGGAGFFAKEVVSVLGASAYAFLFTYFMLIIINYITRVKVPEEQEEMGLDAALHGESAYDEGAL